MLNSKEEVGGTMESSVVTHKTVFMWLLWAVGAISLQQALTALSAIAVVLNIVYTLYNIQLKRIEVRRAEKAAADSAAMRLEQTTPENAAHRAGER